MCQREVEGEGIKKQGDTGREVERLKREQLWIAADQRRCWTVERICVTAISKTITLPAHAGELVTSSFALTSPTVQPRQTSSEAGPNCWAGQPATFTTSRTARPLRRHDLSLACRRGDGCIFPLVCCTAKTFVGMLAFNVLGLGGRGNYSVQQGSVGRTIYFPKC